jgi:hypothetical protein
MAGYCFGLRRSNFFSDLGFRAFGIPQSRSHPLAPGGPPSVNRSCKEGKRNLRSPHESRYPSFFMRLLHSVTLATFLFCIFPEAYGGEKIEGDFGLKLGDIFPIATAGSTNPPAHYAAAPREPEYGVAITNATKPFDSVFVQITPKTHRIFRIIARGGRATGREQEEVKASLREKFTTLDATRKVTIRKIVPDPALPQNTVFELNYIAVDLENLAIKESAETK